MTQALLADKMPRPVDLHLNADEMSRWATTLGFKLLPLKKGSLKDF